MGTHRVRRTGALALAIAVACVLGAAPSAGAQAPASHAVVTGLALPGDLAWGPDGRLYTTDHLAAAVSALTVGTAAAPGTATPVVMAGLRSPGAIAFDQAGNLWVTDNAAQGGGTLLRVPTDGAGHLAPALAAPVGHFTDAGGQSLRPDALAMDNLGNLYVGMDRNGEIAKVTTIGTPTVQREFAHTSTDSGAIGLARDGRGHLLISEDVNITLVDLAPGPSPKATVPFLTSPLGTIGLVAPTDLVVTPDSLLILDTLRVVQVPMAAGVPNPAAATDRMDLQGTAGGLVADQVGRTRLPLGDLPFPALLAGNDPGAGAAATGSVVVSDAALALPGITVPPPLPPPPPAPVPPPVAQAARPAAVLGLQVLPRGTRAPRFPRLRRSGRRLHPGAGRLLSVTFVLPRSARVTFSVRNRRGRLVRRMRAGGRARGTVLRFNWDGRDRRGRFVRAGLYRFRITADARGYHRVARGTLRVVRGR